MLQCKVAAEILLEQIERRIHLFLRIVTVQAWMKLLICTPQDLQIGLKSVRWDQLVCSNIDLGRDVKTKGGIEK